MSKCVTYYNEKGMNEREEIFGRILDNSYTKKHLITYAPTVKGVKQIYVIMLDNAEELAGCTVFSTRDGEPIMKCSITTRFFRGNRNRFHHVCSLPELEKVLKVIDKDGSKGYNLGHALEYKLHSELKLEWKYNTTPYTEGADLEYYGGAYQIKSFNGSFSIPKNN